MKDSWKVATAAVMMALTRAVWMAAYSDPLAVESMVLTMVTLMVDPTAVSSECR